MLGSPSGVRTRCKPMPSRLLTLLLVPVLAVAAVACGSDKTQSADSSTDTSQLLQRDVREPRQDEVRGREPAAAPHLAAGRGGGAIAGSVRQLGAGRAAALRVQRDAHGGRPLGARGRHLDGREGVHQLQNTSYAVSDLVSRQLAAGYQQSLRSNQSKQAKGGLLLGSLGIDFTKWLKDAQNAGNGQVGDMQTVKITGQADSRGCSTTWRGSPSSPRARRARHVQRADAAARRPSAPSSSRPSVGSDPGLHGRPGPDPAPARAPRRPARRSGERRLRPQPRPPVHEPGRGPADRRARAP